MPPGLALDLVTCWRVDTLPRLATARHWNTTLQTRNTFFGTLASMSEGGRETREISWRFSTRPRGGRVGRAGGGAARRVQPGPVARAWPDARGPCTSGSPPADCTASTTASTPSSRANSSSARGSTWPPSSRAATAPSSRTARPRACTNCGTTATPGSRSPCRSGPARTHSGVAVHRSTTLTDADVTVVDEHPRDHGGADAVRPRRGGRPAPARAGLRPGRDRRGARPPRDQRPAGSQLRPAGPPRKYAASSTSTTSARRPPGARTRRLLLCDHPAARDPRPDTNEFIVLDDGGPAIRVDFVWREHGSSSRPTAASGTSAASASK